jgi:N4-gp56 family major capsid protein
MAITTTGNIDAGVVVFYDRLLLERARPYLVHTLFGQKRRIPQGNSSTIKMRRYTNLSPALTPITEGVTPTAEALSKTDIQATLQTYGKLVVITDKLQLTVGDDIMHETTDLLAQNMAETLDLITRNIIIASASQVNAVSGGNGNNPTEITLDDIDDVVSTLAANNGRRFTPTVTATQDYGQTTVRPAYWGIFHPDIYRDIKAIPTYASREKYHQQGDLLQAETGATDDVRWVMTSFGFKTEDATPIYKLPIMAQNSYGCIELDGEAARMFIRPFGYGDDPLEQRMQMGWKSYYTARLLNDTWLEILCVTKNV